MSGPDNSTYTNTNPFQTSSTVPTHASVKAAMKECLEPEMLRITRIVAKTNLLVPASNLISSMSAEYPGLDNIAPGNASGSVGAMTFAALYDGLPALPNFLAYAAQLNAYMSGSSTGLFVLSLDYSLGFANAPFQSLAMGIKNDGTFPILQWDETPLADAFDEYGNVDFGKVIASNLHWAKGTAGSGANMTPATAADLNQTYTFYNESNTQMVNGQHAAIRGAGFDMAAYSSCMDLKLGITP